MTENGNPILVSGGTGTLGRLVVARLLEAGRERARAEPRPKGPRSHRWCRLRDRGSLHG